MQYIVSLLKNTVYFGNSVFAYLLFLLYVFIGVMFIGVFNKFFLTRFKNLLHFTFKVSGDEIPLKIFKRTILPLLYISVIYFSLRVLDIDHHILQVIKIGFLLSSSFFIVNFVLELIDYIVNFYISPADTTKNIKMLLAAVKFVVWGIVLLIVLDNIGVNVSALVAGLGIGGIAVALASQTLLADLLSYMSICFDRPFEIGDTIIQGEYNGQVESIGLKTTRLRSLSGEEIICANADLTKSRLRNYKRMERRRVVFSFGVSYETPTAKLRAIPLKIKEIIENIPLGLLDRAHFSSYGDFSLIFEVAYFVKSPDTTVYMDVQQQINLAIKEYFEQEGIVFAYPTQLLLLRPEGGSWMPSGGGGELTGAPARASSATKQGS